VSTQEIETNALIARAMEAARELTGMELAYVSEFLDGDQVVAGTDGDPSFGIAVGDRYPLETTFCQRMVDGRAPSVIPDTAAEPGIAPVYAEGHPGAYVGVPLRLPDGRLYGSFCCVSHVAEPELDARHADILRMFARLVGDQIAQARDADAMQRAQHEFLASVSHDLRSPLIAVTHLAEDLAAGHPDVDVHEAGQLIEREARHVLAMVEDMMLVSRQRAGALTIAPALVDLTQLAREAAEAVAVAAGDQGDRIVLTLPGKPLVAEIDAGRMTQAIRNLLENGLKYSPGGGPVQLRLVRDDTVARIEVQDHGIGIAPDDQARLGERFFRAASATDRGIPGIGLGLATTQAIATLHEGTLTATSTPGLGSTFALVVPLRRRVNG
jgi:signal transduction histidine kinase